jgi:(1->4)-alpha-D-glucan 1-alpha-D-glucosylmutase
MNAGFTLSDARARIDYFARLGVSHLYCSPVLAARAGSTHGYDVVDPTRINPELGSEDDLRVLSRDLHARDMGLILDIVPNHMGIGAENSYWDDVLTYGERSRYARWFDIDWAAHADRPRKLILPILGDELDRVLERGELTVRLPPGDVARLTYFDRSFPLDPSTLPPELQLAQSDPEEARELVHSYAGPAAHERLSKLLDAQRYELVSFRRGASEVNYRRFFDVADLVGLRMEDPAVFAETHAFILRLVGDGVIDGLRVDHIDGLSDPAGYLTRLRASIPADAPIFVEKILAPDERLRSSWPVQGTTGYEFLNALENIFIDPDGLLEIDRDYRRWHKLGDTTFRDVAYAAKKSVLDGSLRADVERLAAILGKLARGADKRWTRRDVMAALADLAAALPVYRTYIDSSRAIDDDDRDVIEQASREARRRNAEAGAIVGFIADVLLGRLPGVDETIRGQFVRRFQQLTGPAAAKGLEDSALYVYLALVSRNEVGGAPDRPLDDAVTQFHESNARRAGRWPIGLLCTTTHDTKRSADVRSRLDALSEVPHEWSRAVHRWRRLNRKHRRVVKGRMAPDSNSEYLLYQTLVALWPPPRPGRRIDDLPNRAWRESTRERLTEYMLKAAREAKARTSWTQPDAAYERAIVDFVAAVFQPADDAPFLADVSRLVSLVAPIGARNALARIAVHLTAPGTPDVYQGDELWNASLVDPDNRRPVDFDLRVSLVAECTAAEPGFGSAGAIDLHDNRTKLYVTTRLLEMRRRHADLFARGAYRPLAVIGPRSRHVIAFAREYDGQFAITIAARLTSSWDAAAPAWWAGTGVALPPEMRGRRWESQIVPGQFSPGDSIEIAGDTGGDTGGLFVKLPMIVAVG